MKLDIDPLKDIPDVTVQESTENVRAGLFQQWVGLHQYLTKAALGPAYGELPEVVRHP